MSTTLFRPGDVTGHWFSSSPGPWRINDAQCYLAGAVLIEDAAGEIIGWATDAGGRTTEAFRPDRRHPDQIRQNALRFAAAPELLHIVGLAIASSQTAASRLSALGEGIPVGLGLTLSLGKPLLRRLGVAV